MGKTDVADFAGFWLRHQRIGMRLRLTRSRRRSSCQRHQIVEMFDLPQSIQNHCRGEAGSILFGPDQSCSERLVGRSHYPLRKTIEETVMGLGRGILLWLLGIPLPIIILLAIFWH
jgi:hypothetical protein